MKNFKILFFIAFLSVPYVCQSTNNIATHLDSIINSRYSDDSPGISILIAKGDRVIYERQRGIADVESGVSITPNTRFNIASVSKQFTVAGILALQDAGKLNIEDNVITYFPEFKSNIWKQVKLKHLMSHTSGVPDLRPRDNKEFTLNITDEQSIEYMVDLDSLKFTPGAEYDYINPTFQLCYAIINRISGSDFETYQALTLFQPAKMENTLYFSPSRLIPNMAHGYMRSTVVPNNTDSDSQKNRDFGGKCYVDKEGVEWHEYDFGEETFFATKSDGGIYSTPRDILKWELALINNRCFSEELKTLAYTPQIEVTGSPYCDYQNRANTWYGYGWFIDNTPGFPTKIYHTGDNGGFQIYVGKYIETDLTVIIFENRNDHNRWDFVTEIDKLLFQSEI